MLSADRNERPTASQVKEQLATLALHLFPAANRECSVCKQNFVSKKGLHKHIKKTGHRIQLKTEQDSAEATTKDEFRIRGAANVPTQYHYEDGIETQNGPLEGDEPPPCVVCWKGYDSKRRLFRHLYCGDHVRGRKLVMKRLADNEIDFDEERRTKRLVKWIQKDMQKHD
ncbi:hypothetical protein BDW02DRAFT_496627 [Decorospora gaudefroyi]|uniref:C2H2-type domain-containing protein n=1 Tax=Decorospora gaudefroyi TaxID=184978 RepID=A0A6A5KLA8_9PLEO|nr:hypothetical protein BDW02DRAFT_496627 [Decorospora gaudefroyi]